MGLIYVEKQYNIALAKLYSEKRPWPYIKRVVNECTFISFKLKSILKVCIMFMIPILL